MINILKGKTATEISQEINCKNKTYGIDLIKDALKRFKINKHSRRYNRRDKNRNDYFNFDREIIEGSLLGDGQLWVSNTLRKSSPYFRKNSKFNEYINWNAKQIFTENYSSRIHKTQSRLNEKWYSIFVLTSLTHDKLKPYYYKWYKKYYNRRKKTIPKNLKLTKKLLLVWFLDDGTSAILKRKNKRKPDRVVIKVSFCTDCFTKKDLLNLSKKLYSKFKLRFSVNRYRAKGHTKRYYRMYLSECDYKKFYAIIGPPPVKCLAYKWRYAYNKNHKKVD